MLIRMKGYDIPIDPSQVATYIRWSTDDQATGTTLEVQTEKCQEWLRRRGLQFREDLLFVDEGYSGGNMDRPALTRLREFVQSGLVQAVVVYKLDRLSRSVKDAVNLVMGEWEGKCVLQSTVEEIDTSTQQGKQIFYMLSSFAEWERAMIRDRTYEGKLSRAKSGLNAGQKYPLGYKPDEGYQGPGKRFARDGWDPERKQLTGNAALVRSIFDMYLGGRSLSAIAHLLNKQGVPCPGNGKWWRFNTVGRIIENPIYCGRYQYGLKPDGAPIFDIDEAVPAIVTLDEWQMCQQIRRETAQRQNRERANPEPTQYLLSGIARCDKCGHRIGGCRGSSRRYYQCTGATILKQCDCGTMHQEIADQAVITLVKGLIRTEGLVAHTEKVCEHLSKQTELAAQGLNRARHAVGVLIQQAMRVEKDYLGGELRAADYYRLRDQIARDRTVADKRLAEAETEYTRVGGSAVDTRSLAQTAADLRVWETLPFERMKRILMDLVAELRLYQPKSRNKDKNLSGQTTELTIRIKWRMDSDDKGGGCGYPTSMARRTSKSAASR